MSLLRFCFLFVIPCLCLPSAFASPHQDLVVKVLIEKTKSPADLVSLNGRLQWKTEEAAYWTGLASPAKIWWDKETERIRVTGSGGSDRTLLIRGGDAANDAWTLNGKRLRGVIQVSRTGQQLAFVLRAPLEIYTEGVVLAEMGGRAEFEALKAQAVAARTFVLHRFQRPRHSLYDVQSSTMDQVFDGFSTHSLVADAVRATKGQYLYFKDAPKGKTTPPPFKAFFHSRCGGQTSSAKDVWLNPEGNQPAAATCEYCQKNHYRWRTTVPLEEMVSLLKVPMGPLQIEAPKTAAGGRVLELTVRGKNGAVPIRAEELRQLLGFTRLQSSQFTWELVNSDFLFTGHGAGHGVGLCQWGARGMARAGKTYEEILSHYYTGARIYLPEVKVSSLSTVSRP